LKILMTTDAVGGVWQYSLDLAAGLSGSGVSILLATLGPRPSAEQRQQANAIPHVTVAESDFPLEWMDNPWSGVDDSAEWLLQLQADYCADVVHLNGYSHASVPWNVPVLTVAHSCVFSWWRAVHGTMPGPEWGEYKTRVTRGLNVASAIVAPTTAMAASLSREYGIPPEKIETITNFSSVEPATVGEKESLILAAGRIWDAAKNLEPLSRLAPQLHWNLRIADGKLPHPALLCEMGRASIFVHASLYEPFGLSVLEAARSHCCLVLSDIPSLRELWDGAAVFVSPREEHEWVSRLNTLAKDEDQCKAFARLAFARSGRYDASSSIHKYRMSYEMVIENARRKRRGNAA
jgi:hypothetical protein